MVDPSTGIRTEALTDHDFSPDAAVKAHDSPLASTLDYKDQCILEVDGNSQAETCDFIKPCTGADAFDVRRLFLAETRVAAFHIQAFAWQHAYQEACTRWLNFVSKAISHSVDFSTGDGNLFAQRNFKRDSHSDLKSCILVDLPERLLDQINKNRAPVERITYNIGSSTQAAEYIKAQTEGSGDCDCIILISLCYGKQHHIVEDRGKNAKSCTDDQGNYSGPSFENEIILSEF